MRGVTIHVQAKNYNSATGSNLQRQMERLAKKHAVEIETFRQGVCRFQKFHPTTRQQEEALEVALKFSCLHYAKIVTQ